MECYLLDMFLWTVEVLTAGFGIEALPIQIWK